jgi:cysteine-rich repeat protein
MKTRLLALLLALTAGSCLRGTNAKITVEIDAATLAAAGPITSLTAIAEDEFQIIGKALITGENGAPLFDPAELGAEESLRKDFTIGFRVTPSETLRVRVAAFDNVNAEGAPLLAGRGLLLLIPRDDGDLNRLTLPLDIACGNRSLDDGEVCDDGNSDVGDGCDAVCEINVNCGNGTLDAGEACDEGPNNSNQPNSDCRLNCTLPFCGDNIIDNLAPRFEECDPPDGETCDDQCKIIVGAACGDGVIDAGETCDDANTTNGDGCSSACQVENGFSCAGEPSVCTLDPVCGNGTVEAGETCDDANTANNDGCSSVCAVENGFSCAGQPSVCAGICGDGLIRGGEGCDDANTTAGDGCDAACQVEGGFTCAGEPSVCS